LINLSSGGRDPFVLITVYTPKSCEFKGQNVADHRQSPKELINICLPFNNRGNNAIRQNLYSKVSYYYYLKGG